MKDQCLNCGATPAASAQDYPPVPSSPYVLATKNGPEGFDSLWDAPGFTSDQLRAYVDADRKARTAPTEALSAATVAQPTDEQIRRLFVEHGHLYAGWLELGRSILSLRASRTTPAAQPCPSQGCGEAGSEGAEDDDQATWPEWATDILNFIRSQSGYDDMTEGVDLPQEVKEHVSELNHAIDTLNEEVKTLRALSTDKNGGANHGA